MVGGDLTGKVMIPVIKVAAGWSITERGRETVYRTEEEVSAAEKRLRDRGAYPFRTTMAEVERVRNAPEELERLRERLVRDQLERWRGWAEERLGPRQLLLIPGNDDPWIVDDYLKEWGEWNIDGRSIEVRGLTVIGIGVSNRTPWNAPRELEEEEIASRIDEAVKPVGGVLVFNIHVPPYGTRLDVCPRVDEDLRPVIRDGEYELIHAGSAAVREAIEKYRPVLSLHGHIHESAGVQLVGPTVAINPGSEYGAGVLRAALVTMVGDAVQRYQLVSG